ncbi:YD repeat-containing protein [Variovorax sp. PDC80]|uniref:phage head spike fiber domain-containing protein n=1 Tax=Variovorax sp. PDC80 TaxID=1882827 RepID=UPI0008F1B4C2|nr:hypothetical protein [Variovorax sp. PDC80]SFO54359.1 YD repeat-containing protein [Variovorax sp. PDC80]
MVAIVSGNSLGLSLTSLGVLGPRGGLGVAGQGRNGEQAYVNIANGNLVLQDLEDKLVGRGADIGVVRTYNSQGLLNDDNADNWVVGAFGQKVVLTGTVATAGSTLVRTDRDGASATYTWNAAKSLYISTAGAGAFDTIAYDAGAARYVWTDGATGLVERYESTGAGRLMSVADPAGNTVAYTYNAGANGLLQSMVDANGETTYFDYTGTNLTQIRTVATGGATTTRVRYAYDSANRLSTVTVDLSPEDNAVADGKTYVTTYGYDGTSNRIASVTQSDGTSLAFTYVLVGTDYRVATVKDGLGQSTSYAYDSANRTTTVTDAMGLVSVYVYDAAGQLTQIKAPAVNGVQQITTFTYDANGHVTRVTDPKLLSVDMAYDANGNQRLQRDAAGNTITRTFDARNRLLSESVYLVPDPDAADAGVAPSQPLTTRYIYAEGANAAKDLLRFVLSPEGRVTEYRYDSYGQRTSALTYAAARYTATSLAEADLATWVGTPQNYTQASRTDTVYDARGQVQKVTVFSRVDAAGNGVADASQSITQYVYDRAGLLLSTVSATAGTTTYTYDGKGRVLSTQNALNQSSLTRYDDANNKTIVTLANGLITTSAYDKNGRLVSITQGTAQVTNLGTTSYAYDKNGRLYQQTDPTNVRSARLYDEVGRLVGEIDSLRRLTEYVYDKNDQLTQKIVYATSVNATTLAAYFADPNAAPVNRLAALRPVASTADQDSWRIYDNAGRLVRTVDGAGAVVDMRYDGASRLVATTAYANPLTPAVLGNLSGTPTLGDTNPTANPTGDRVSRRLYDNDGLLVGTLDAEGYLTESRYDAQGRLITQVSYAAQITDATLRASGTLAQLVTNAGSSAPLQAQNQTSRWLYDAQNRVIAQIDAEGYLSENVYDANGNVTSAKRYNTALSAATLGAITTATTLASLREAAGTDAGDRTTTAVYDKLNRVTQRTNFEGSITQYVYDTVGNLVSTTTAAGSTDARVANARYDAQGRLVGELTGVGSALLVAGQTQAQIDTVWAQNGLTHAYDSAGRRISTTDGNGNKTLFFYDTNGQLSHSVNALGEVTERQYNLFGQLEATLQIGTRLTSAALTALGGGGLLTTANTTAFNALKNTALDSKQSFTYTVRGQVSTAKDALGNTTTSSYNAFGERTGVTQDLGGGAQRVQSMSVDRRGLVTGTVTDASGINVITSAVYDAFARLVRSSDDNGNVHQQSYDRLGRTVSTTDALNKVRTTTYDAFDRVLTQVDALGRTTSYTYDNALRTVIVKTPENVTVKTTYTRQGQKLSVLDGNNVTTTYAYDKNGNLLSTTSGGSVASSTYDRTNRLIQTKDANGNLVDLTYDAANRVLTRTVDKTGLNLVTTYAYDAKGLQFNVTDPNGTLTKIVYDLEGQVTRKEVDPTGLNLVTQYSYDAEGRVLTTIDPTGTTTQYVYDKLGRRVQERIDPAGLNLTRSYTYDKGGNVTSATDANNQVTRYVYDSEDRLVFTLDPAAGLQRIAYDAEGRVVLTVRYATPIVLTGLPAMPAALTFDQLNPKVPVASAGDSTEHRVLDQDGRLVATVNGLGEVVKYAYDGNGNVIDRIAYANPIALGSWVVGTVPTPTATTNPARDMRLRTVYDALNRATFTIDGVGAVKRNVYDANGNVVERIAYAVTVPPATEATTAALTAAVTPLANAGRDAREVMVYDRANRLIASTDGVGTVTQRLYDKNGNVTNIGYTPSGANLLTQSEFANGLSDLQVRAGPVTATTMTGYAGALKVDASTTAASTAYKQLVTTPGTNYTFSVIVQMDDGQPPAFGSATFKDATNSFVLVMYNAARNTQQYTVQDLGGGRYRVSFAAVATGTYTGFGIVKYIENDARGFKVTGYQLEQASAAGAYVRTGATTVAAGAATSTTRYAYDAAGRLVYTVGAQGQVEKNSYDAAGRVTLVTRYAKALNPVGLGASPTVAQIDALVQANTNLFTQSEFANGLTDAPGRVGVVSVASMTGLAGALRIAPDPNGPYSLAYKTFAATPGTTYTLSVIVEMEDGLPPSFGSPTVNTAENSLAIVMFGGGIATNKYVVQDLGNGRYRISATAIAPAVLGLNFGVVKYTANDARPFRVSGYQLVQAATAGTYVPTTTASTAAKDQQQHSVYDKAGRLVATVNATTDALGSVVKYTRDANGNVIEQRAFYNAVSMASWVPGTVPAPTVSDALDQRTRSFYDAAGRVALSVDALGNVQRNEYDALGRLTRVTRYPKPVPAATTNTYQALLDAAAALVTTALPAQVAVFVYDAAGRKVSQTSASGRPEAATTVYVYDGLGLLIKTVEARGVELSQSDTTWALVQRQQLGIVNAAGGGLLQANLTQAQRDSLAARYTTTNAYDAAGRKISVTDPLGGVTESSYDANGNVVKITDPLKNSAFYYFDAAGRVKLSVDPEGYATATTYDTLGKTLSVKRFYNKVTGTYSVTQAPALPTTHASDALTQFGYDASGRLLRTTDAEGKFESYTYNALGQRETLTNKRGGVTIYVYDRLGRVVSETLPITSKNASGQLIAVVNLTTYDAFGNKLTTTEAAGLPEQRLTTYTYDGLNRQLTVRLASVSVYTAAGGWTTAAPTRTNTYDASGNLIVAVDANGGRTRSWFDSNGRKVAEVSATGTLSQWTYDAAGNVLSLSVYGNPVALPAGDALPVPVDANNLRKTTYKVDANNRVVATTVANLYFGSRSDTTGQYEIGYGDMVQETGYDANGQVVRQKNGAGALVYTWYDKLGQKVLEVDPLGYAVRWERDTNGAVSRETRYAKPMSSNDLALLSESNLMTAVLAKIPEQSSSANRVTEYTYDRNGRMLSESRLAVFYGSVNASTGALSETTAASTKRYGYDAMGNQNSVIDALNQRTDLVYDVLGRLLTQQKPTAANEVGTQVRETTDYEYDGLNNVRREIRRGTNNASEADDQIVSYGYDATGVRTSMITAKNETFTYGRDANGNMTAQMVDRVDADGAVSKEIVSIAYDAANRETTRFTGTRNAANAPVYDVAKTVTTAYNTYGQIASKKTGSGNNAGAAQEYYDYDGAGRLWRSNSQDGISKAWFYDLAGNATLLMQSQTVDLRTLTMSALVGRTDILQTITIYDKRNQALSVIQPKVTASRPNLVLLATPLSVDSGQFGGLNLAIGSSQGTTGTPVITGALHGSNVTAVQLPGFPMGYLPGVLSFGSDEFSNAFEALYGQISTWKIVLQPFGGQPTDIYAQGGGPWPKAILTGAADGYSTGAMIYAITASGEHIQAAAATMAQVVNGIVVSPTGNFLRLTQGGISEEEMSITLYDRPLGSNGPFGTSLPVFKAGKWGESLNDVGVNGWYTTRLENLNGAATELLFVVTRKSDGAVVRRDSIQVWPPTGVSGSVAPEKPIFTHDGIVHFSGMQTSGSLRPASIRVSQRSWWEPNSNFTSVSVGKLSEGLFDMNLGWGTKDLYIEMLDKDGIVIDRVRGKIDPGTSLYELQFVRELPSTINFQGIPTNATSLTIEYTPQGPGKPAGSVTLTRAPGATTFEWDTRGAGLIPDFRNLYSYAIKFVAKDADGFEVIKATGNITVGAMSQGTSATLSGSSKPQVLTFDPGVASAQTLKLRYREKGAGAQANFSEVVATRTASGVFKWDATAAGLKQDKEYEYLYDIYNAAGAIIGSGEGYFRPDNSTGNDAANIRLQWIIPNLPGGPTVPGQSSQINSSWQVQRSQSYDAFGQITKETDGNGNATTLSYNALGQLVDKIGPATSITQANGQAVTVTPTEHYSYNLNGQLVGKRDANGNQSTLVLDAAGRATAEWHPGVAAGSSVAVRKAYDVFGNLRTVTDEIGRITNNSYDANNRLVRIDRPVNSDGSRSFDTYEYDALGQRIAHANALGFRERTYYDSQGRVTRYVSAEGRATSYAYTYDNTIGSIGGVKTGGWVYTTTDANGRVQTLKNDVFGRTMWKQDLGGHQFTYGYNWSGLIASQTGTSGQNITYAYYANGYLRQVIDAGTSTESYFEYDNNGNRTFEGYKSATNATAMVFQQSNVTYDEFNRVKRIVDDRYVIEYEYDANGNRRRVKSQYKNAVTGGGETQDYWYTYDNMNRFTVTMGQLVNGQIVRGSSGDGVTIEYDNAGQRKAATYANDGHREDYDYNGAGNLTTMKINGVLRSRRTNDLAGRVTLYEELAQNQTATLSQTRYWDKDNLLTFDVDSVTTSSTQYLRMADGTLEFTKSDNYDFKGGTVSKSNTGYTYEWWDSAKQKEILVAAGSTGVPVGTLWMPGYSVFVYDVNGHVKAASDPNGGRTFTYWTNAEGQVLQRDEYMSGAYMPLGLPNKNRSHRYFYFDGKRVGNVGNDGTEREDYAQQLAREPNASGPDSKYKKFTPTNSADFDENYQPINSYYPSATPGNYTVRAGDTLESIARAVWGDASLWYMLADANGLDGQPSAPLVANTVLVVPNRVTNVHNTSETFRPYDPGKAMGDTSPTLPEPFFPPSKDKEKCGGFGQIIQVVVTAVVAYFTGYYLGWGVAGGAAAGAAGSIAGQTAGIAMGVQDSFSWKAVGLAAIGGAVGGVLNVEGLLPKVDNLFVDGAIRGAVGSVATQGLAVVTGLQQKFDWRGVAAAAAGGAVSAWVGQQVLPKSLDAFSRTLASQMAGGVVNAAVRGGSVSRALPGIMADVVGSTIGNALGDSIAAANTNGSVPGPVSADERSRILGYFVDGPGDGIPRVNGLDFSQDAAMRKMALDPYNLSDFRGVAPTSPGSTTLDIEKAQQRVYVTGRKPVYDFGDPLEGGDVGDQFAAGSVRVMRGNAVGRGGVEVLDPVPSTVNGVSVNQRTDALFQLGATLSGAGDLYRDIKLLGPLMSDMEQQNTIDRLKGTLQDKLGMMRVLPSEADLGAVRSLGSDGVPRYDKQDLIDRYSDANRKVELMKAGVIELDLRSMLITSIGTAKLTPDQWVAENTRRYQSALAAGLEEGQRLYDTGNLRRYPLDMPGQLQVGLYGDGQARDTVIAYNRNIGVPEGAGQLLSMNRWSYDPSGSGLYNRIDLLMDLGPNRSNGLILRTAIEGKSSMEAVQASGAQIQRVQNWVTPRVYMATPQGVFPMPPAPKRLK